MQSETLAALSLAVQILLSSSKFISPPLASFIFPLQQVFSLLPLLNQIHSKPQGDCRLCARIPFLIRRDLASWKSHCFVSPADLMCDREYILCIEVNLLGLDCCDANKLR